MKRNELKVLLMDLGLDQENINKIAGGLTQAIGESNNALINRKVEEAKAEWNKALPKEDAIIQAKVKELGYESFEDLSTNIDNLKKSAEAYTEVLTERRDAVINKGLTEFMTSKGIDNKYSKLVMKAIDKDGLIGDDQKLNQETLNERAKAYIEADLTDIIGKVDFNAEPQDPQQTENKPLTKLSW